MATKSGPKITAQYSNTMPQTTQRRTTCTNPAPATAPHSPHLASTALHSRHVVGALRLLAQIKHPQRSSTNAGTPLPIHGTCLLTAKQYRALTVAPIPAKCATSKLTICAVVAGLAMKLPNFCTGPLPATVAWVAKAHPAKNAAIPPAGNGSRSKPHP